MLNPVKEHIVLRHQPSLVQWARQAVGLEEVCVQARQRGNNLHLLCESDECPEQEVVLFHLVYALKETNLEALIPANQPQIYQVLLYGRVKGYQQPSWTTSIHLNQLDRYLEQFQPAAVDDLAEPELVMPEPLGPYCDIVEHFASQQIRVVAPPQPSPPEISNIPTVSSSALIVSNRSLAKQGNGDAIARYLSETLSALGVGVEVRVKTIACSPPSASVKSELSKPSSEAAENDTSSTTAKNHRLWIFCEAAYSPDPTLLGDPIAQQLRDLQLEGFRDALIFIQVTGEEKPDWILRVDLTPPTEMLKELAQWGDLQAIARLVNQALADEQIQATMTAKESTLHLVCERLPGKPVAANALDFGAASQLPALERDIVTSIIAPLLESLAPQGIYSAAVYGQVAGQEAAAWVEWVNLPASIHSALAESALSLAQQGDQPAIAFLLNRLLNRDLDWQLTTGGIRVQLLLKEDLLHVMSDAPVCPQQKRVGPAVVKFLRQLQAPGITGVRVYGRRAGQKQPLWSYGGDFISRDRLVPEATPEFAASDAYMGDLLSQSEESVFRPVLTPADLKSALEQASQSVLQGVQWLFIQSQLFVPRTEAQSLSPASLEPASPDQSENQGIKVALVWGAVGLLLTCQADWLLGQTLRRVDLSAVSGQVDGPLYSSELSPPAAAAPSEPETTLPQLPLQKVEGREGVFETEGFTQPGNTRITADNFDGNFEDDFTNPGDDFALPASPRREGTVGSLTGEQEANFASDVPRSEILAIADSPYPTFNSRQLDEKLALYHQRLVESGPADVLIVGSSRALRGVDPVALQQALASLGYSNVQVFNFGVNGATAQVVDLIIRQILTPEQLPKIILWADGARAFNSGRVDITYNAIAVSEGYQQLADGSLPALSYDDLHSANDLAKTGASGRRKASSISLAESYRAVDGWLSQSLSDVSAAHSGRDRLKILLGNVVSTFLPRRGLASSENTNSQNGALGEPTNLDPLALEEQGIIDFDGFLPLSIRFNPATYYQRYARVPGNYDTDYDSFQLDGKQDEAMTSLLQFTQSRGIPVVFVNLPLTGDYLDPVRLEHEQEFQRHMLELATTQRGFVYRDLGQSWLAQNDYFSDPSHLNRYGAYQISNRLAQDVMIPWSRSQQ